MGKATDFFVSYTSADRVWDEQSGTDAPSLGDLQGARDLFKETLTARRRVLGDDHLWTLATMSNLSETLRALGDLRGALELHKQTLTARQGVLGPDDPDTRPRQQPRSSPLGLGEL